MKNLTTFLQIMTLRSEMGKITYEMIQIKDQITADDLDLCQEKDHHFGHDLDHYYIGGRILLSKSEF